MFHTCGYGYSSIVKKAVVAMGGFTFENLPHVRPNVEQEQGGHVFQIGREWKDDVGQRLTMTFSIFRITKDYSAVHHLRSSDLGGTLTAQFKILRGKFTEGFFLKGLRNAVGQKVRWLNCVWVARHYPFYFQERAGGYGEEPRKWYKNNTTE